VPRGRTPADRKRDEESRRLRDATCGGEQHSPELREALGTPLQQSGLTLSVQAAAFNTRREASVALAIELDGDRLEFTPNDNGAVFANSIEVSYFGVNAEGRPQRATRSELNLSLRPESYKRVTTGGLRLNPRLTLEPGRYQIRIGARDSLTKQLGTVFYDLHVPDFRKDPLMMSGLLLTTSSAQQTMTAQPDPATEKLLPAPATSRRTFAMGETLTVFAEIYDNMSARQSRQFDVAVTFTSEDGKDAFSARVDYQYRGSRTLTVQRDPRDSAEERPGRPISIEVGSAGARRRDTHHSGNTDNHTVMLMKRHHLLIVALLLLTGIQSPVLDAQDPQGPPEVTFQVEVNYVDVDAVVTDEQGTSCPGSRKTTSRSSRTANPRRWRCSRTSRSPFNGRSASWHPPVRCRPTPSRTPSRSPAGCT
jgi:hypothetical protein